MKRFLFAALAAVLGGTLSAHAADDMARGPSSVTASAPPRAPTTCLPRSS